MTRNRSNRGLKDQNDRMVTMFTAAHRNARATWYKQTTLYAQPMTAARGPEIANAGPGSFLWAKRTAKGLAKMHDKDTEHWAAALLQCPTSSLNHRTVRIAGKPYHWRQDYTGQLKLAAGESPW